jgi:hypothetical protein
MKNIEKETVFPISLADEVFDILLDRDIKILKYNDLDTKKSFCGSKCHYLDEYVRFRTGGVNPFLVIRAILSYYLLKRHQETYIWLSRQLGRKSFPATVILQHDADVMPERTVDMMKREHAKGIKSSCFVFAQHAENVVYKLPVNELKEFEQYGFEIGYHLNAFERANYNINNAFDLVKEDLDYLSKFFNITSYVPHGGAFSKDGRNNYSLPHKKRLKTLTLAYNGHCLIKESTWSDGGIKKQIPSDPRVFARSIPDNSRALMLMHPQYYGDILRDDWQTLPISKKKWWRDLWHL